ncbi:Cobalt-zinc-cadmium resistance protein CzcA [Fulvivirga imtechensis AK7]|uniref:Cobalt-zinc-cadmium resistance protein CzcA n=1 Tax=Fulvivirga imtechensis AK7 TaxID=1237149 RepID=L8JVM7_9BACT|nr:efflux RND transporter permease subunit [Fulvivirga imtechensis]ELR73111.1 Cobalt-zinc-cadmium resistance protein CzcA [Fulvivirga imtechensis AK7]
MLNNIIRFFLENKLVTALLIVLFAGWGLVTAPFDWDIDFLPRDPVPVDAIPDLGENQQIVFTEWPGRSPQDIEDQITYPLTTSLLGIPGVRSIRSSSMFGFSSIYIIFNEEVEFYWSRSRVLEKLNSMPSGVLPDGVQPALGPDATALGQIYWYTLEGRDEKGNPTGGWDPQELRTIQDFYVRYGLSSSEGVAEVASIGGFVKEYQIDVRPEALRAYNIGLHEVMAAVQNANRDVGAKTLEINKAEYLVRGLGYVKTVEDLEKAVIKIINNVPVRIGDVAVVAIGPATRRGVLDKGGAEVTGGVVVARYGANPLQVIKNVKEKIAELESGLPVKTLEDGTVSKVTIVPFYDRTQLIYETLGTLEEALSLEILITIIVIIVMVVNLRTSVVISFLLPLAVLMVFISMRYAGVDANIVALSGIAIAIGTMVDLGIILTENVIKYIEENKGRAISLLETIYTASAEVSSAIVTAVSTTIISFIPVFTLEAAEGKLFRPLAFTKTFALVAAVIIALFILPTLAHWFFGLKISGKSMRKWLSIALLPLGVLIVFTVSVWGGIVLLLFGLAGVAKAYTASDAWYLKHAGVIITVLAVTWLLAMYWLPLGVRGGIFLNIIFVVLLIGLVLGGSLLLIRYYTIILRWCLDHKKTFLLLPAFLVLSGIVVWQGFNTVFGFLAVGFDAVGVNVRTNAAWSGMVHTFPGVGKEFMPSLNEGSFLLMPTSMPHAGMEENIKTLKTLDMRVSSIPEVDVVVGKLGRVESALDPAPISMYENVINYKPEYAVDDKGRRMRFKTDDEGRFLLRSGDALSRQEIIALRLPKTQLMADDNGEYFRNWRDEIQNPGDIWNEIVKATNLPGVTSAPRLQPIETRLVMLQTGMRAPMGIKIAGPDLETIEAFGFALEEVLKMVPSVKKEAVFADRVVGKPYIQLNIDRDAIARYGLTVEQVQRSIETAIGGMKLSTTVEGRERFPIRIRYPRELRDDPQELKRILIMAPSGAQVPLGQLSDIEFVRGPQVIKSEETFLTSYVLFDKKPEYAEVDVVNDAQKAINDKIAAGELTVPHGVSYRFSGTYENQVRAEKRLFVVVPLVLIIIFLILYFQFRSVLTSLMVFTGIAVAFSGGFVMIWLYGQAWFADFEFFDTNMRGLFQMKTINLSVAVWVGFIALFGIATDDGVLMTTYLDQHFAKGVRGSVPAIRTAVTEAAERRVRPAMMTTATTLIALVPILTSTGKGSDIMVPMAIPIFGGMTIAIVTIFVVPVLYGWWKEATIKDDSNDEI